MLSLVGPERELVARALRGDARAYVAGRSAAELWLGLPLRPPVVVATARRARSEPSIDAVRPAPSGERQVVSWGEVRVSSLERTIVDLLGDGATAQAWALASQLVARGGVPDLRTVDVGALASLASRGKSVQARARVAYLALRLGQHEVAARLAPRSSQLVRLDPSRPAEGPRLASLRVVLNAGDPLPCDDDEPSRKIGAWAERELGEPFVELCILLHMMSTLDRSLFGREGVGARGHEVASWLLDRSLLVAAEHGLVATPLARSMAARRAALAPRAAQRRVLQRAARALSSSPSIDARLGGVRLLLEIEGPGAAAASLASLGPRVASARDGSLLASVVDALAGVDLGAAHVPALERLGRLDDALSALSQRGHKAPFDPRLAVERARIAWRAGRVARASRELERVERASRKSAPLAVRFEACLLSATLLVEQARHDEARASLARAMALADAEGTDLERARTLHRMGTLEARLGKAREAIAAYRAALAALARWGGESQALEATLHVNLAFVSSWLGLHDDALAFVSRALLAREARGQPREIVSARVLRARILRARGGPLPGDAGVGPLALAAEACNDARLATEAWLDLADELARHGGVRDAREAVERARMHVAGLAGAEPILDALVAAASGWVRTLEGDRAGVDEGVEACERLVSLGARYYASLSLRRAASAAHAVGLLAHASRALDASAVIALREGYHLGDVDTHAALYAWALSLAPSPAAEMAARDLRDEGAARPQRAPAPPGARGRVLVDRAGARLILPSGHPIEMGRRRVLLPLLEALSLAPDGISSADLVARVLERRDGSSARAALKVSVSRLRSLLGAAGVDVAPTSLRGQPGYRLVPAHAVALSPELLPRCYRPPDEPRLQRSSCRSHRSALSPSHPSSPSLPAPPRLTPRSLLARAPLARPATTAAGSLLREARRATTAAPPAAPAEALAPAPSSPPAATRCRAATCASRTPTRPRPGPLPWSSRSTSAAA